VPYYLNVTVIQTVPAQDKINLKVIRGAIPDVKKLGELTDSDIENRIRDLTRLVVPRKGEVDEDAKLGTVLRLVDSARGSLQQRVEDLELLGELGITFEPVQHVSRFRTATQASKVWSVSQSLVIKHLANPETASEWGAKRGKEGRNIRWEISEETVNRINLELKLAVPLRTLYRLLRNRGVRMDYHVFKKLFLEPGKRMRSVGKDLLEIKGNDNLLVDTIYGEWKDYTDVTSAAGVARFLLEEKERLDEGYSSRDVGERLGIGWAQVNRLLRKGKLPGVVVRGIGAGRARVRLTEEELEEALRSRGSERGLIQELKAIKLPGERRVIVEYPNGFENDDIASARKRIARYGGAKNLPDFVREQLEDAGVTFREETEQEARARVIITELVRRFGSIDAIRDNVSAIGLAELGIEIERRDGQISIRPIRVKEL